MKLPRKWLEEYVNFNVTNEKFVELMMWRGFEIASVDPELPDVTGVVVGRVLTVDAHPNADKLHICTVDVGGETPVTIVCGAPNVTPGVLVPVALPGATLPGNITIAPTVMRGVQSNGMLCSGKELGMTDVDYPGSEVNGLLLLQEDHPLGQSIAEAVGLDSVIFDIELTPNRADCASIVGICREAAAALGQTFTEPVIRQVAGVGNEKDYAQVTVLNTELCPRYSARVVTDIKVEPSPLWLQKKLRSVGLRPINNIVDITNLVMVEYGHPMHAFDLACVVDGHIVVRNAVAGEVVRTLDGKDRAVDPDMLLIADPQRGVGIAGVMGGENSEITPNTKTVLFEAAAFKGSNIRGTTRRLHHTTDAAARFIKGVEPVNAGLALDRAVELVQELQAGTVIGSTIDVCAADLQEREIDVNVAHINKLLHTAFTAQEMADMLATIQIAAEDRGETLHIRVPHYRVDIESGIEADWDIAEEVARLWGYYNIEPTLMGGDTFCGAVTEPFAVEDQVKDQLAALGAYEMYNYNFIGPALLDALRIPAGDEKRQAVKLLNPFGEDQSLMRTTLLPGMLKVAATNLNRKTGHGRFFEVGNIHLDNNDTLPEERKMIGLMQFGEGEDFFTLKGSVERLFSFFGVEELRFVRGGGEYFHPGRKAQVFAGDILLGELGELHPAVAKAFDLDGRIYAAELSFAALLQVRKVQRTYVPLPRFPMVQRDLALIVDQKTESALLRDVIRSADAGVLVENVSLFDAYQGPGVPAGRKSLAYTFTLRAADHTLTDEEIKKAVAAILDALAAHGAQLRM